MAVLSWNVYAGNDNYRGVADEIHRGITDADGSSRAYDVIALYEVTPQWLSALAPALVAYPHRWEVPRLDYYGIAIYSRWPFQTQPSAENTGTMLDVMIQRPDSPAQRQSAQQQPAQRHWRFIAVHTHRRCQLREPPRLLL